MVFERLRLRFGVIAVFFVFASIWAGGMAVQRHRLPSYEAHIRTVEGSYAPATITGHGRSFEEPLAFDAFSRGQVHAGDVLTVHCDIHEDTHVCFTGTLASSLSLLGAFGLTSLLAALALLRPWLVRWFSRDAGPDR